MLLWGVGVGLADPLVHTADNLLKEAEEKVVYRRFEQEHLGKLQTPADITERITHSGVGW